MDMADEPSLPQEIDPAMVAFVDMLADMTIDADGLVDAREGLAGLTGEAEPEGVQVHEHVVDAEAGIVVRVLRPLTDAEQRPCLFWIHGGGYVLGNRSMDDIQLAASVRELGCVTASVEYRLAPEHPYPTPLEDCYAGLRWVIENAGKLGIDPQRVGIGGVSAGGGLAAALAQVVRDRGELSITFQLLDSPMLDDRQVTSSSQADWLAIWSRESNTFGWQSYLGDLYGTESIPAHAAPARSTDLRGLAPALIVVGGADGFRDEDIEYATRLNRAGVLAELHVYPGAPHGFSLFPDAPVSQRARSAVTAWLDNQFGPRIPSA